MRKPVEGFVLLVYITNTILVYGVYSLFAVGHCDFDNNDLQKGLLRFLRHSQAVWERSQVLLSKTSNLQKMKVCIKPAKNNGSKTFSLALTYD